MVRKRPQCESNSTQSMRQPTPHSVKTRNHAGEIIRTTRDSSLQYGEVMPIIRDRRMYRWLILSDLFSPPSGARFQASTYENEISMKVYFLAGLR
jgi:hypothetical protein